MSTLPSSEMSSRSVVRSCFTPTGIKSGRGHSVSTSMEPVKGSLTLYTTPVTGATESLIACPHFDVLSGLHLRELFALRDEGPSIMSTSDQDDVLMDLYFNRVLQTILDQQKSLPKQITTDWVLMVFRGLCWYSLHRFKNKFAPVDEQYFESKQPIYIG